MSERNPNQPGGSIPLTTETQVWGTGSGNIPYVYPNPYNTPHPVTVPLPDDAVYQLNNRINSLDARILTMENALQTLSNSVVSLVSQVQTLVVILAKVERQTGLHRRCPECYEWKPDTEFAKDDYICGDCRDE